jgi:hypothetical protein
MKQEELKGVNLGERLQEKVNSRQKCSRQNVVNCFFVYCQLLNGTPVVLYNQPFMKQEELKGVNLGERL